MSVAECTSKLLTFAVGTPGLARACPLAVQCNTQYALGTVGNSAIRRTHLLKQARLRADRCWAVRRARRAGGTPVERRRACRWRDARRPHQGRHRHVCRDWRGARVARPVCGLRWHPHALSGVKCCVQRQAGAMCRQRCCTGGVTGSGNPSLENAGGSSLRTCCGWLQAVTLMLSCTAVMLC